MKYITLLIFILNIISFNAQIIKQIRKDVTEINNYKNYKIKILDNNFFDDKNEVTDNGQELKGYFKDGELSKMVHWIGLSNKKIMDEYYFGNGQLIFVSQSEFQILDEKGYLNKPKLISIERYYFYSQKLIKKEEKQNDRNVDFLKQSRILKRYLKVK